MSCQTSILEFPSLKRTRRYGSKVRTGCLTCKARRIKCDEGKPFCARCTSTGRKCDGYFNNITGSLQTKISVITSLKNSNFSWSGEGVQCLEFYHRCAVYKLSNRFDNGFWSQTAPQMAQSEPAIEHAIIALGYLAQTETGSIRHARAGLAGQGKVFNRHYGKAVESLIDSMSKNSCAIEVGLTACLLFVCIEFLRGNFMAAYSHLQSGLKIIAEITKQPSHEVLPSSNRLPSTSSPSPKTKILKVTGSTCLLDNTLIPMFMRNIPPAMLFGAHIEDIFDIPIPDPRAFDVPFATFSDLQSVSFQLRNASALFARTMATRVFTQAPLTMEEYIIQSRLLEAHHSWTRAFTILENKRQMSHEDNLTAALLKLGHYSTYILIDCAMDLEQTRIDEHLEKFKMINRNARIVLGAMDLARPLPPDPYTLTSQTAATGHNGKRSATGAHFTFEISVIPALFYVATRCRCPLTRREAVALMATNPPREGIYDPETHVTLANRVIEIEESSLDPVTGWPTESSRLWCYVQDADGYIDGKILVTFALVQWVRDRTPQADDLRPVVGADRADAQWQEFL